MTRNNNKKNKKRPLKLHEIKEATSSVDGDDISLDLPELGLTSLPFVSVITITKDRRKLFSIALFNWMKVLYPENRIEWIVLDDGDEDISNFFPKDDMKRIRYIKCEKMDIGAKRNKAVSLAKYEYIVHMDDDDYYFPYSVLSKIRVMLHYDKQCVYSHNLGVYDILTKKSIVMEKYTDIPECSMAYTKTFWESRKFGKSPNESYNMVNKREKDIIKLPFLFNCISCTHPKNYSTRLKSHPSYNPSSVDDLFPEDFKHLLTGVERLLTKV
jgi:glycosyltransferase involved in cell wall biosynthesis